MHIFTILSFVTVMAGIAVAAPAPDLYAEAMFSGNTTAVQDLEKRVGPVTCGKCTCYNTGVGYGSCGQIHADSDWTVALPNIHQSNNCGRKVSVRRNPPHGMVHHAAVEDTCPSCSASSVPAANNYPAVADLSPVVFRQFMPSCDGWFSCCWYYY